MFRYDMLRQLVKRHRKADCPNALVLIPFSDFPKIEEGNRVREYDWWAIAVSHALLPDEKTYTFSNYAINCVCVKRIDVEMELDITMEIPYGSRTPYQELLYEICQTISMDGDVTLFVNNNPYHLKAYACVSESDRECADKIRAILSGHEISYDTEKGFVELMQEAGIARAYQVVQLPTTKKAAFDIVFKSAFFFQEERALQQMGYDTSVCVKRKKVFISYCHNDKKVVYDIVERLESCGINLRIDKKCIDYGENLSAAISNGIAESDLAILFLSTNYAKSKYAQFELQNIAFERINDKMKWFTIKMDDVDVNQMLPVLSNYKYYDFHAEADIDRLVKAILKRVQI